MQNYTMFINTIGDMNPEYKSLTTPLTPSSPSTAHTNDWSESCNCSDSIQTNYSLDNIPEFANKTINDSCHCKLCMNRLNNQSDQTSNQIITKQKNVTFQGIAQIKLIASRKEFTKRFKLLWYTRDEIQTFKNSYFDSELEIYEAENEEHEQHPSIEDTETITQHNHNIIFLEKIVLDTDDEEVASKIICCEANSTASSLSIVSANSTVDVNNENSSKSSGSSKSWTLSSLLRKNYFNCFNIRPRNSSSTKFKLDNTNEAVSTIQQYSSSCCSSSHDISHNEWTC